MEKKDLPLPLHLLLHKEGFLIQILSWLPLVSLLRCKSVCKSWRDLIQSPFFIDLHTTNTFNSSSSSSNFGSFILHVYFGNEPALLMLSSQSESESVSISGGSGGCSNDDQEEEEEEEVVVVVDDLGIMDNLGIMSSREDIVTVGSCNGLVSLHRREIHQYGRGFISEQFSLWNPATGEFRVLPESITTDPRAFKLVVFGFDVETKDYKVVQFTHLKPRFNGNGSDYCFCQVQVYSLNTDSWRLLEGIPCLPGWIFSYAEGGTLYLNGTCFFLAHFFYTERYPCLPVNDRFIISFDFTKETITPIQLPDHDRNQKLCLCSLGGDKIALFTSPKYFDYRTLRHTCDIWEDFNIWVLNYEHGSSSSVNKKSWTKLYSFRIQLKSEYDWYIPRGISNDGKFALLAPKYGKKMTLYNLDTNEVKRDFLSCSKVESKALAYKPSLVSVTGGNGAGSKAAAAAAAADRVIWK